MYGQANYGPAIGQGSQPPRASLYQQQRPPGGPLPPNLPFQPGPPLYHHHGPPAPFPPLRTLNPGESYRHLTPPNAPQLQQHSSHFGPQNVNQNGPQPLGVLPPPPPPRPPQGTLPHRPAFYPPPPYPGGVQGVTQMPLPPPSPVATSGFFSPVAYGCSASRPSSVAPDLLPRPSCPPHNAPSPSMSTSTHDGSGNWEVGRRLEVGTQPGEVSLLNGSEMVNPSLPPPPPPPPPQSKTMEGKKAEEIEESGTSNSDSDMEMEDDITLTDKDQAMSYSTEVLSNAKEIGENDPTNPSSTLPDHSLVHHIPTEFLNMNKKSAGSTPTPTLEVLSAECQLDSHLGKVVSDNSTPSGTSLVADPFNSKKHFIKVGSPMRLLQDYASNDSSENEGELLHKDIYFLEVLPSNKAADLALSKNMRNSLEIDTGAKSDNSQKKEKEGPGNRSQSHMYHKVGDGYSISIGDVKADNIPHISTRRAGGDQDNNAGNQNSLRDGTFHEGFHEKAILHAGGAADSSKKCNARKGSEEKKIQPEAASIKVDEFGRLVREASDGDSDSGYSNRHERRIRQYAVHSHSHSRSRSPLDRRRTKSSRRRRNYERSRSHSRSPRNRRSRSRSPTFRRAGEFNDGKFRSNRGRGSECFDFLRGKCYRGASCRFTHHEVNRRDSSRSYRSKQKHPEIRSATKNHKTKPETKSSSEKLPEHLHNETLVEEISEKKVDSKREDINMDSRQTSVLDHSDELVDPDMVKPQSLGEVMSTTREMKIVTDKPAAPSLQIHDNETLQERSHQPQSADRFPFESVNCADDTSLGTHPMAKNPAIHQPQSNTSIAEGQNAVGPQNIPASESAPNNVAPTGSLPSASFPGPAISHESCQIPPPLPIPISHGANAPHMQQWPMAYNSMPHGGSYPPPQFAHGRNPQPYQVSAASQQTQFPVPPYSTWNLPPLPPRPPYDLGFTHGVSSQFQPSLVPPRNEVSSHISARSFPAETSSGSQNSEFPHQPHPSNQEPPHRNLRVENSGPGDPSHFGPPGLLREDRSSRVTVQELSTSTSLGPVNLLEKSVPSSEEGLGSLHRQSVPSAQDLSALPFPSVPSLGELPKSSAEIHYSSHIQQASSHLPYPLGDSRLSVPGKTGFGSQYLPDLEDKNHLASASDFGLPRIIPHHNPYASTFEQPLCSKFGSAFSQGKGVISMNQYDISSRHVTVDEQGVGDYRSRQTTSSPSSARDIQKIIPPGASGELYNPLVDSIEPTSSTKRKENHRRNWGPASDSDRMDRHSGSNNIEVTAAVSMTSLDNDEFGETADAEEVGAVENESLSDVVGVTTASEIETKSKSKSPGEKQSKKKKKKRDSRSTKPFKMAIADFVKDVLKPSWRQGNMSKEAFKTIVKKTVDKVSGAMKGHNVPKSQSKIDQYIDSSQRKLTKLVMGYVDKYVKV